MCQIVNYQHKDHDRYNERIIAEKIFRFLNMCEKCVFTNGKFFRKSTVVIVLNGNGTELTAMEIRERILTGIRSEVTGAAGVAAPVALVARHRRRSPQHCPRAGHDPQRYQPRSHVYIHRPFPFNDFL